jgi:pimeloyl-ACP methyl ester carboxylesterase
MLEIIDKGHCTHTHPVPVLFVHGGCHGAWCWDEHFLDFFAGHGFRALAVSFRGHGGSALDKPLENCGIADYVEDVQTAVDGLGCEPVFVGHSLGGFVLQKYLEIRHAPAAVLMASAPPRGILRTSLRIWRRHPWVSMHANIFGDSHGLFNTPKLARDHLFSASTPDDVVIACAQRVQPDSLRATFIDQLFRLPDPARVTTPMLVLGGESDGIITVATVRDTARAYRTDAVFFPDMGHNMMVEPAWRDVAEYICGWLEARDL